MTLKVPVHLLPQFLWPEQHITVVTFFFLIIAQLLVSEIMNKLKKQFLPYSFHAGLKHFWPRLKL